MASGTTNVGSRISLRDPGKSKRSFAWTYPTMWSMSPLNTTSLENPVPANVAVKASTVVSISTPCTSFRGTMLSRACTLGRSKAFFRICNSCSSSCSGSMRPLRVSKKWSKSWAPRVSASGDSFPRTKGLSRPWLSLVMSQAGKGKHDENQEQRVRQVPQPSVGRGVKQGLGNELGQHEHHGGGHEGLGGQDEQRLRGALPIRHAKHPLAHKGPRFDATEHEGQVVAHQHGGDEELGTCIQKGHHPATPALGGVEFSLEPARSHKRHFHPREERRREQRQHQNQDRTRRVRVHARKDTTDVNWTTSCAIGRFVERRTKATKCRGTAPWTKPACPHSSKASRRRACPRWRPPARTTRRHGPFCTEGFVRRVGIGHGANVGQQDESQFPTSNDPVGFKIS